MKKRLFYIVHLDQNRIVTLVILFIAFVGLAFATGYRTGTTEPKATLPTAAPLVATNSDLVPDVADKAEMEKNDEGFGKSIYEKADSSANVTNDTMKPSEPVKKNELAAKNDRVKATDRRIKTERAKGNTPEKTTKTPVRSKENNHRDKNKKAVAENKKSPVEKRKEPKQLASDKKINVKKNVTTELKRDEPPTRKKIGKKTPSIKDGPVVQNDDQKSSPSKAPLLESDNSVRMSNIPVAPPSQRWSLQVGAYSAKESADRSATLLKKEGFPAWVSHRGTIYAVMVGNSEERGALFSAEKKLKAARYAPVVVPIKK